MRARLPLASLLILLGEPLAAQATWLRGPLWTSDGTATGEARGASVASAGDIDGDGFEDLLVGAPGATDQRLGEGAVSLYLGGSAGFASTPAGIFHGGQRGAALGSVVTAAGDVNGDGYGDVVVTAPRHDKGLTKTRFAGGLGAHRNEKDQGRVYVFHGSSAGPSTTPARILEGLEAGELFGSAASCAGDVNGDGFDDVVIGATGTGNGRGGVFVYHGSPSGVGSVPQWFQLGAVANTAFGSAVSAAGDVDGDGFDDILAGAYLFDGGNQESGRVLLLHGSVTGIESQTTLTETRQKAHFGFALTPAGDVDDDGFDDFFIGAPGWNEGGYNQSGAVFLYMGGATVPARSTVFQPFAPQSRFGSAITGGGDLDGDGFRDLAVGAPGFRSTTVGSGRVWVFRGGADGIGIGPDALIDADQIGAQLGSSLAWIDDGDGDGLGELVVGAPGYDSGANAAGRVEIHAGNVPVFTLEETPKWTGGEAGAIGYRVAGAGDVNGDGYRDAIVGDPEYPLGTKLEGAAYIYFGTALGLEATPGWEIHGDGYDYLGYGVAGLGDLNGDGFDDVGVGAYLDDTAFNGEGSAFVYYGSASGPPTSSSWSRTGNHDFEDFGSALAGSDVNGDGYGDLIVGAQGFDAPSRGAVYAYHGSGTGLPGGTGFSWRRVNPGSSSWFGRSVANAGDVNSDGYEDIVVGAPGQNTTTSSGSAYLFLGSAAGLEDDPAWSFTLGGGARLGTSVAGAGDINGDGYDDVVVGAPADGDLVASTGSVYVFLGAAGGLGPLPSLTLRGEASFEYLGFDVSSAGDVDGDGYDDVLTASYFWSDEFSLQGRARLYRGGSGGPDPVHDWWWEGDYMNARVRSVAPLGDIEGDGRLDVLLGLEGVSTGETLRVFTPSQP